MSSDRLFHHDALENVQTAVNGDHIPVDVFRLGRTQPQDRFGNVRGAAHTDSGGAHRGQMPILWQLADGASARAVPRVGPGQMTLARIALSRVSMAATLVIMMAPALLGP